MSSGNLGGACEWHGRSLWIGETCPCVDGEGKGCSRLMH